MSTEKPHFIARRMQGCQRENSRPLKCPKCWDGALVADAAKLLEHATIMHPELVSDATDGPLWKKTLAEAKDKTYVID